jgi:hypothetical protein
MLSKPGMGDAMAEALNPSMSVNANTNLRANIRTPWSQMYRGDDKLSVAALKNRLIISLSCRAKLR